MFRKTRLRIFVFSTSLFAIFELIDIKLYICASIFILVFAPTSILLFSIGIFIFLLFAEGDFLYNCLWCFGVIVILNNSFCLPSVVWQMKLSVFSKISWSSMLFLGEIWATLGLKWVVSVENTDIQMYTYICTYIYIHIYKIIR